MAERERCPSCGGELPANAPQGLCPACLLRQGLESEATDSPSSTPPSPPDPDATKTFEPGETPDGVEIAVEPGTKLRYLGDYELIRELGRGGMGVVYKARQLSLNRPVASSCSSPTSWPAMTSGGGSRTRPRPFALLDHPHIVPIFEVGEYEGRQYFSMKLVGGPSLEKRLSDYAADPKAAAPGEDGRGSPPPCPSARHPAPRSEALQHPVGRARRAVCDRFRSGEAR